MECKSSGLSLIGKLQLREHLRGKETPKEGESVKQGSKVRGFPAVGRRDSGSGGKEQSFQAGNPR